MVQKIYLSTLLDRPLCVKLPEMTGYVKKFDKNGTVSFKIRDKELFKKYN